MKEKHLHIITHDVPYPADFGGVVDIFYKIKTLSESGIKIHLHCFQNKRPAQKEMEKYCVSVNYYQRKMGISGISLRLPFIVSSRRNKTLIENLQKDNYPVFIEGIHCSFPLYKNILSERKMLLRLHNVEFEYYHHLAKHENHFLKKIYFLAESFLLEKYEQKIANKATIACVSMQDVELYKKHFKSKSIFYLPVFLPHTNVKYQAGKGKFCLYQGNLSVNENEEAVIWLLQNVFNDLQIPFVVAGKNPSQHLKDFIKKSTHISLIENPDDEKMQELILEAQINILPSFNNTGIKLKLLNALFNGRFCVVNKAGVQGSGLESLCHIAETVSAYKKIIAELFIQDFSAKEYKDRKSVLEDMFDNKKNAALLVFEIFGETLWI